MADSHRDYNTLAEWIEVMEFLNSEEESSDLMSTFYHYGAAPVEHSYVLFTYTKRGFDLVRQFVRRKSGWSDEPLYTLTLSASKGRTLAALVQEDREREVSHYRLNYVVSDKASRKDPNKRITTYEFRAWDTRTIKFLKKMEKQYA